jgi:glucose dehydrogenase
MFQGSFADRYLRAWRAFAGYVWEARTGGPAGTHSTPTRNLRRYHGLVNRP